MNILKKPPAFDKKLPRHLEVNEGEKLELKTQTSGSPIPEVKWYKDGVPISPNDSRIKTTHLPDGSIKLEIENAVPTDSGAYKLELSNSAGDNVDICAVAVQRELIKICSTFRINYYYNEIK